MRGAAIELGGTKVLVTVGEGPVAHAEPVQIVTRDPETTLRAVVSALASLRATHGDFSAIGVAGFGPLELDPRAAGYGRLLATPKPGWSGADLLSPLRAAFDVPTALETDVNAAALGEERWGAARGASSHAYITVGTGVGVGVVINGAPVHGAGHPEAGHLIVRVDTEDEFPGVCAWHGRCVEGLVSGPALEARLRRPGVEISDNDPVWRQAGRYLGQLCAALVLTTAPSKIVLGGGVGRRSSLLNATRKGLVQALRGYVGRLDAPGAIENLLVPASLDNSGLLGALLLAQAAAAAA